MLKSSSIYSFHTAVLHGADATIPKGLNNILNMAYPLAFELARTHLPPTATVEWFRWYEIISLLLEYVSRKKEPPDGRLIQGKRTI